MWELKEKDFIKCGNRYFNVKLINVKKGKKILKYYIL